MKTGGAASREHAAAALCWLILLAIALTLRIFVYDLTTDTSWLLTIGERMFNGERLYIDVMEVNPPASAYLYLPVVALARIAGIRAETIVEIYVFGLVASSLWFCWRQLRKSAALQSLTTPWAGLGAFAVLSILPGESFTQREHIAVILLAPWLAVLALRMEGRTAGFAAVVFAGTCAGIVFCIKPVFVLPLGLCAMQVWWASGKWQMVFSPENWIGALISGFYVASTILLHPSFFSEVLPVLNEIYIPLRYYTPLYTTPIVPIFVLLMAAAAAPFGRMVLLRPVGLLLSAAAGFFLVALWQGKFWAYHFYPAFACAILAAYLSAIHQFSEGLQAASHKGPVKRILNSGVAQVLAIAFSIPFLLGFLGIRQNYRSIGEQIVRLAGHGATVMSLSADIATGHPAARMAHAQWVGSFAGIWPHVYIGYLRAGAPVVPDSAVARHAGIERWHAQIVARDLRDRRPDVVLSDLDSQRLEAWTSAWPEVAGELKNYEEAGKVIVPGRQTPVRILVRKDKRK